MIKKIKIIKKKILKKINKKLNFANVYILSTFNNTIITITDKAGNTLYWSTSSKVGFKGAKKCSAYAAQIASETVAKLALKCGIKNVDVFIKGPGIGRDLAVKGIVNVGINILSISDTTPIPHNGCKARKIRRI